MKDNMLQTEQMFEINKQGKYININKEYFIKQTLESVQLFGVTRQIQTNFGNINVNFTDINGNLYLTQDQLVEMFNVSKATIGNHINTILGEWLRLNNMERGGSTISTPLSHTIYSIPVTFDPVYAVGGI